MLVSYNPYEHYLWNCYRATSNLIKMNLTVTNSFSSNYKLVSRTLWCDTTWPSPYRQWHHHHHVQPKSVPTLCMLHVTHHATRRILFSWTDYMHLCFGLTKRRTTPPNRINDWIRGFTNTTFPGSHLPQRGD